MKHSEFIDLTAALDLLKTGCLVDFEIVKTDVKGPDPAEFSVEIQLAFPRNPETEETDLPWGAFGFLFVLGSCSFADARPRGMSETDYREDDEFNLGDFIAGLSWEGDRLRWRADYLRGRRMKTEVVLRPDGTGTLKTTGRGMTPQRWLERLRGEGRLRLVKA